MIRYKTGNVVAVSVRAKKCSTKKKVVIPLSSHVLVLLTTVVLVVQWKLSWCLI